MRGTAAGLLAASLMVFTGTTAQAQDATNAAGQSTGSTAAPTTAAASQPAPDPPAPKPVTLTVGMDFPSAYMFRGIFQEDKGFIGQPFVDVGIAAAPGSRSSRTWNAFTPSERRDHPIGARSAWYEMYFYASRLQAGKSAGLLYPPTPPNDASSGHELRRSSPLR